MQMISRVLALLLVVGGVVGMGAGLMFAWYKLPENALYLLLAVPFVLLFGSAILTGIRLWQDTAWGRKWAIILFASQVPVLSFPGLVFLWYTGLQVAPVVQVTATFEFGMLLELGASGQFFVGGAENPVVLGVNVFALAALVFLVHFNNLKQAAAG